MSVRLSDSSAGGLVALISANAVQAAPAGLGATIVSAALACTAVSTSTVIAATKAIAMTAMTNEMDLAQEQQDKIYAALYQLNLNQASALAGQQVIAQARAEGNYADFMHLQMAMEKQTVEDKLRALDGILTADQMKIYQQRQSNLIEMQTNAMEMFRRQSTYRNPQ